MACVAGEANEPGGIFDRLSDPNRFTGVYRRGYNKGGINHHADDEAHHDIGSLVRPGIHLHQGGKAPFRV